MAKLNVFVRVALLGFATDVESLGKLRFDVLAHRNNYCSLLKIIRNDGILVAASVMRVIVQRLYISLMINV